MKEKMSIRKENHFYSNGRQKIKMTKRLKETTRERHLFWNNYYSCNNFGLWIECTKCKKWRKSFQYIESQEVPKEWYCNMNIAENGKPGSCEEPEESTEEEFVDYSPGSIVWAKLDGYPWWPGMIDEDPDSEEYYWKTQENIFYNVTFLDERVTRAWIPAPRICEFLKFPKNFKCLVSKKKHKYTALINKAEERALEALKMPLKDRLEHYSFANLYQGKWPRAHDFTEEVVCSDDITDVLLKEVEEIDKIDSLHSEESDFEEEIKKENFREVARSNIQNKIGFIKNVKEKENDCVKKAKSAKNVECNSNNFTNLSPKLTLEVQIENKYLDNTLEDSSNCKQEKVDENKKINKNKKKIRNLTPEKDKDEISVTNYTCYETENIHEQKNGNTDDEDTLQLVINNNTNDNKTNSSISETIEEVIRDFAVCSENNLKDNISEKTKKFASSNSKNNLKEVKQKKRKFEILESNSKNTAQNVSLENDSFSFKALIAIDKVECESNISNNITKNNELEEEEILKPKIKKVKSNDLAEISGKFNSVVDNCEKKEHLERQNTTPNLKPKIPEKSKSNIVKKINVTKQRKDLSKSSLTKCMKNETSTEKLKTESLPNHKKQNTCLTVKPDKCHKFAFNKSNSKSKPVFKTFKMPLKDSHERYKETFSADDDKHIRSVVVPQTSVACNGIEMTPASELNAVKSTDLEIENLQINEYEKKFTNLETQTENSSIGNKKIQQMHFNGQVTKNKTSCKSVIKDEVCQDISFLKLPLMLKSRVNGVPENISSKCSKLKNAKSSKIHNDSKNIQHNKLMDVDKSPGKPKINYEVITVDDGDDLDNEIKSETLAEDENCFVIPVSDEETS